MTIAAASAAGFMAPADIIREKGLVDLEGLAKGLKTRFAFAGVCVGLVTDGGAGGRMEGGAKS